MMNSADLFGWLFLASTVAIVLFTWWSIRRARRLFDREMREVHGKDDRP